MIIIELHYDTNNNGCRQHHVIRRAFGDDDINAVNEFYKEPKNTPDYYGREFIIVFPK